MTVSWWGYGLRNEYASGDCAGVGRVKERSIIFSAAMVGAIMAGRKTQTRRVVKSLSTKHPDVVFAFDDVNDAWWPFYSDDGESTVTGDGMEEPIECPYGRPGERLWVRESGWERPFRSNHDMREGADTWARYYYDASGLTAEDRKNFKDWGFTRRPSVHMPRWASRIALEITSVRVERLQGISPADCVAEGVDVPLHYSGSDPDQLEGLCSIYRDLWESINAKRAPWASNPWVWVVEFEASPNRRYLQDE